MHSYWTNGSNSSAHNSGCGWTFCYANGSAHNTDGG